MDERRNGTRRLYRVRPEGMAELRAFLEEFWDARLDALKREAEREERKKDGTRPPRLRYRSTSASSRSTASPGDGVGVPRRPGEGGALEGPAGDGVRPAAGWGVPDRDRARAASRAASSSSSSAPRRLVYTWGWEPGAGRPEPGAARRVDGRDRARAGGRRHEAAVHAPRPAERRVGRQSHGAGLGSLPRAARTVAPAAATRVATRGSESRLPDRAPPWRMPEQTNNEGSTTMGKYVLRVQGRRDARERGGSASGSWRPGRPGSAASATRSWTWATRSAPRPRSAVDRRRDSPATRS